MMDSRRPRRIEGAAQRQGIIKAGTAMILPFPRSQQPDAPLHVAPELARMSALTRTPADRLRVGRHVRRWRLYLRGVEA